MKIESVANYGDFNADPKNEIRKKRPKRPDDADLCCKYR